MVHWVNQDQIQDLSVLGFKELGEKSHEISNSSQKEDKNVTNI